VGSGCFAAAGSGMDGYLLDADWMVEQVTALRRLWELFEKWDARERALVAEYRDRERMIFDVIRTPPTLDEWMDTAKHQGPIHDAFCPRVHDHADETRPE
jgi:hypothetical protein